MLGKTSYSENHRNKKNTRINFEPQLGLKGSASSPEGNPSSTPCIIYQTNYWILLKQEHHLSTFGFVCLYILSSLATAGLSKKVTKDYYDPKCLYFLCGSFTQRPTPSSALFITHNLDTLYLD